MPRIIIVDENDAIIGYKDRDAVKREDIYRVSALWITNSKGEILLAQRALSKSHDPGKWGPAVAGTVEEGEDYETNIIKEAAEEIGLRDIKPRMGPKERRTGEHNYFCQRYLLELDKPLSEFVVDTAEVAQIRWFSKEELLKEMQHNPDQFLKSVKRNLELFCK